MLPSALVFVVLTLFCCKSLALKYPSVPCPEIFQYVRTFDGNMGLLTLEHLDYGETVVELELSQAEQLYPGEEGYLNLNIDQNKIPEYIRTGRPITYKVNFPLKDVVPQVSAIRVNGKTVCFGRRVPSPSTTMLLKHTLTAPRPFDNVLQNNIFNLRRSWRGSPKRALTESQYPTVLCPDVFRYENIDGVVMGLITMEDVNYGEIVLDIVLSHPGSIPAGHEGSLIPNFDETKISEYIKSRRPITYKVHFPLQDVVPQVSAIRLNGDTICFGRKFAAPSTTIKLRHTLTAPAPPPNRSVGIRFAGDQSFINPRIPLPWTTLQNGSDDPCYEIIAGQYNRVPCSNSGFLYISPPRTTSIESSPFTFPPPPSTTSTTTTIEESPLIFSRPLSATPTTTSTTTISTTTSSTTPPPATTPTTPPPATSTTTPPPATSTTTPPPATSTTTPPPATSTTTPPPATTITSTIKPESERENHATLRYINSVCGRENLNFTTKKLAVNGEMIPRARFPWIVAIYKKTVGTLSFQCGGSLISTRTVISAAHCFYSGFKPVTNDEVLISLGRHNLTDWSDSFITYSDVEKIIRHPDYRPELDSIDADLAIVRLQKSVPFSQAIRPVCLWQGPLNVRDIEGVSGIVVGWGRDEHKSDVTTTPRLVTASIASELACIRSNQLLYYLTSNRTLCAGNRDGTGPCNGDSGSGLMIRNRRKWMIRGTVSAALGSPLNQCNLDEYVIYTDIAMFIGWIQENMLL